MSSSQNERTLRGRGKGEGCSKTNKGEQGGGGGQNSGILSESIFECPLAKVSDLKAVQECFKL